MSGIIRKKEPGEAWESVADTDSGGGGGLPTGWTQDGDPADVNTNGGSLVAEGASSFSQINPSGLFATSKAADGFVSVEGIGGVVSAPDTSDGSPPCFTAAGTHGATVALDAGGLEIVSDSAEALAAFGPIRASFFSLFDGQDASATIHAENGVVSRPLPGSASFTAEGDAGATVALHAGGLTIDDFASLNPTAPPVVPLTLPTVQDVIDALVALGLVTQSD
jgi:hypothetical protein